MIYCHNTNFLTFSYIFISVSRFIVFHGLLIWVVAPNCRQIFFFWLSKCFSVTRKILTKKICQKISLSWFGVPSTSHHSFGIIIGKGIILYFLIFIEFQSQYCDYKGLYKMVSLFPTYSKLFWLPYFLRNVLLG